MNTVRALPLEHVCDLDLPRGEGDKQILRNVARVLNLPLSATLTKRAMQFGSRIANKKVPGTASVLSVALEDIVNKRFQQS